MCVWDEARLSAGCAPAHIWLGDEIRVAFKIIACPFEQRELVGEAPIEHLFEGHRAGVIKMLRSLRIPTERHPVEVPVGVPGIHVRVEAWIERTQSLSDLEVYREIGFLAWPPMGVWGEDGKWDEWPHGWTVSELL
ncbi:hypothetical protein D3C81_1280520 [compost metagenome]